MKKLYVNGCSFTYGHTLPENKTWPYLLAKELELELHNNSKNGQSMHSISFNTFMHLASFDPEDTLVVVGLTWPTRLMVQAHQLTLNISPNNPIKDKYYDKIYNSCHPEKYIIDDYNEKEVVNYWIENNNISDLVLSLINLQKQQTKIQTTERNLNNLDNMFLYYLITLQGYLECRGFKYRFINFQKDFEKDYNVSALLTDLINSENVIDMFGDRITSLISKETSHPSAEGALEIKNQIIKSL